MTGHESDVAVPSRMLGPSFWRALWLLLRAARLRAVGRVRRRSKLARRLGGRSGASLPLVLLSLGLLIGVTANGVCAIGMMLATAAAERVQAEALGRVVVDDWFAVAVTKNEDLLAKTPGMSDRITASENRLIDAEASHLASAREGDAGAITATLRQTIRERPAALLSTDALWRQPGALPDLVALAYFLWWCGMLICQGEGPDFDAQQTRNPMWEWLFSHPAPPAAIFLAEMLAPVAANPMFVTAPLLPGIIFGWHYGLIGGIAAALLIGAPFTVALACVSKAIEIRAILRLSPRARGAVLGLMSWFGFASFMAMMFIVPAIERHAADVLAPIARILPPLPWPSTRLLIGFGADGRFAFWRGLALCSVLAALLIVIAVSASVASARRGLTGEVARSSARAPRSGVLFGREPLYAKEFLWLRRDGGALVQVVLAPLSIAALQVFNFRGVLPNAASSWNGLAGVAILFGTYFLLILGPKSLASEGQALWIALTWPRGLESLLKAKARLWSLIASGIVGLALAVSAWRFPADIGRILLVAALWFLFARSLAEKTVTLATVTSSSGEQQKVPIGLRLGASIGLLTFSIGVMTEQWSLMISGVVYSIMTAAAMWQYFRYRLPYLYDPWSETPPPAPTLLHAMIGVSVTVEAVSILSAAALTLLGPASLAIVNAALYGVCALVTSAFVAHFLKRRGVSLRDIWLWRNTGNAAGLSRASMVGLLIVGAAAGASLGVVAHGYLWAIHGMPSIAEILDTAKARMESMPNAQVSYFVLAVIFAPFAEEYLFRGLLYRALDREWGGWRAIAGAAAFFAVYHPTLSWAPVAALGAMNAWLFRRTGWLATSVAAHMAYNAVVLAF